MSSEFKITVSAVKKEIDSLKKQIQNTTNIGQKINIQSQIDKIKGKFDYSVFFRLKLMKDTELFLVAKRICEKKRDTYLIASANPEDIRNVCYKLYGFDEEEIEVLNHIYNKIRNGKVTDKLDSEKKVNSIVSEENNTLLTFRKNSHGEYNHTISDIEKRYNISFPSKLMINLENVDVTPNNIDSVIKIIENYKQEYEKLLSKVKSFKNYNVILDELKLSEVGSIYNITKLNMYVQQYYGCTPIEYENIEYSDSKIKKSIIEPFMKIRKTLDILYESDELLNLINLYYNKNTSEIYTILKNKYPNIDEVIDKIKTLKQCDFNNAISIILYKYLSSQSLNEFDKEDVEKIINVKSQIIPIPQDGKKYRQFALQLSEFYNTASKSSNEIELLEFKSKLTNPIDSYIDKLKYLVDSKELYNVIIGLIFSSVRDISMYCNCEDVLKEFKDYGYDSWYFDDLKKVEISYKINDISNYLDKIIKLISDLETVLFKLREQCLANKNDEHRLEMEVNEFYYDQVNSEITTSLDAFKGLEMQEQIYDQLADEIIKGKRY